MRDVVNDLTTVATQFNRTVAAQAARQPLPHVQTVAESDLTHLPAPVARYLRRAGVVGRPRVHNVVVEMQARLNQGPGQPWMDTAVLQVSFVDHPTRLFLLSTSMHGLPVSGLHQYSDAGASMEIRLLGLLPIVNASGDAFAHAETVTVLNDYCVLAPAVLIDERFHWHAVNDQEATVTFHNGAHVVSATMHFDAQGDLTNFSSTDRHVLDADGVRWTTPLRAYHEFGVARLASEGDAIWHYEDKPDWCYGTFTISRVQYNVPPHELPQAKHLTEIARR
ncbi:DUF6544 family protein [Gemmatimonas sp.]|jgi:hypothetical protein|uniref:DUF6544 family protein n=1 Tax=Gemmatimonas sp. TaxID=1962908 RepID=UPI0031CA33CB|nr:hypothetical protein [Gemmatimonas sp.]